MKNVSVKARKPIHPIGKKATVWKGVARAFLKD